MPIISGREYLDQLFGGRRRPPPSMPGQPKKEIFVTVGATATFHELIRRVAGDDFQQTAKTLGFTGMNVQCGNSIQEYLDNRCASIPDFEVRAFGFSDKGLAKQMRATQEGDGRLKGVVISHAGAGSVLDAMRLGCSIIVIPNESLLDNHQADLAEELEEQGYATSGTVKGLSDDLRRCVERAAAYEWPPANQGKVIEDVIEGTAVKEEVVREEITNRHMD